MAFVTIETGIAEILAQCASTRSWDKVSDARIESQGLPVLGPVAFIQEAKEENPGKVLKLWFETGTNESKYELVSSMTPAADGIAFTQTFGGSRTVMDAAKPV